MRIRSGRLHRAPTARLALAMLIITGTTSAQATTVYRCGPDLRQYSQHPCAEGRALDVDDRRTPDQVQQGHEAARGSAKVARAIERDLKDLDQHPTMAGNLSPRVTDSASGSPRKTKTPSRKRNAKSRRGASADNTDFTAVDPTSVRKKKSSKPNSKPN